MADELEMLFDGIDGLKEDVLEYGMAGAVAFGASYGYDFAIEKLQPHLPTASWAKWIPPAGAVVLGLGGGYLLAEKVGQRKIASGFAIGLIANGVARVVAELRGASKAPGAVSGLGSEAEDFSRYLGAAPVTIEQPELSGAPVTVENDGGSVDGAPVTVESDPGSFLQ